MAQQIKKKFLSPEVIEYFDNQIDSVEQSVLSEQSRAEGQEAAIRSEFAAADLALDQKIDGNYAIYETDIELVRSDITANSSAISQEILDRQAGDSALDARITTLEGQVGEDLQAAITALQAADSAEQSAREAADLVLDGKIETEKARIDAILLASDADKDSFAEIVQLINSVDTENDSAFASYVLSNDAALAQEVSDRQSGDSSTLQSAKDYTDAQIAAIPEVDLSNYYTKPEVDAKEAALDERLDVLEATKEIIEIESIGDAPTLGLEGKLYVTKDENKLYRWAMVGGGSLTFNKVVGSGEEFSTLESALAAANDGENILVKAGTYLVSSTINVNKQVKIVGEDKNLVIFETAATTSAPVSMFNVSVNNVALAKMTIKHKKTSNTSVETAVVASGGGFPQTRISNFIMENCVVEYAEFGVTVRAESWCVRDTTFTYATGSVSNSCRAIGIYGNKGNSFIKDVFLKNDVLNGTASRPFYLTSTTGSNPNETVEGKLVIEGTTHVGPLAQFFNQDNNQSAGPGTFELQIKNNITNESNLFAAFYSAAANAGEMFSSITLSGNSISNLHAVDGGKGLYGVAGTAAFRSSPLVVHASNNTLGQEVYRAGWGSVDGSLIGKETAVPMFSVSKDAIIPASGDVPTIIPQATGGYVEVSAQPDLSGIESGISALEAADVAIDSRLDAIEAKGFSKGSQVIGEELSYLDLDRQYQTVLSVSVGRLAVHEGEDYTVSVVGGKTRLTWINSLANPSGEEKIETGDKVFWSGSY